MQCQQNIRLHSTKLLCSSAACMNIMHISWSIASSNVSQAQLLISKWTNNGFKTNQGYSWIVGLFCRHHSRYWLWCACLAYQTRAAISCLHSGFGPTQANKMRNEQFIKMTAPNDGTKREKRQLKSRPSWVSSWITIWECRYKHCHRNSDCMLLSNGGTVEILS